MDNDLEGMEALRQVLMMAREHRWQLTLFGVIESIASSARMLVTCVSTSKLKSRAVANRQAQLEALISMIANGSSQLRARVAFGNRSEEIVREFASGPYDLLIKRSENNSSDKFLLKNCGRPVWLLTPDDIAKSNKQLIGDAPSPVMGEQP